jgi:3-deoxy-7-phosphoheptulonate synthase
LLPHAHSNCVRTSNLFPRDLSPASQASTWSIDSWKSKPIMQDIAYPDASKVGSAIAQVQSLPPLVSVKEIEGLREQLAEAAEGRRFVIQGGDCAERFADCSEEKIEKKIRILVQMSLVLTWGARMPTVRIARMAGQYAKPRSKATEMVDGQEVATFRGDNINGFEIADREPDPRRLVEGYFHAAATLNCARQLLLDGLADLHDSCTWNMGFVANSSRGQDYAKLASEVVDAIDFAHTCGVSKTTSQLSQADLFVGHEGLTLAYEAALTRKTGDKYYNRGAQFLWIGDRTRQLDHAHVEYFRGISNPIGIKVGPTFPPEDLVPLIKLLWPEPEKTPGKITLITRLVFAFITDHVLLC